MIKENIVIENGRIGFRNFSGKPGTYNREGDRNFCVFLETKVAEKLQEDGWNIRWLQPRDPEDPQQAYLGVAVSYKNIPPKIWLVTSANKTLLDEDSINVLDLAEIEQVDLIIRPYNWDRNGKQGVKAYVKSMFVKIVEDELELKYRDVPDSAFSPAEEDVD